MRTTRNHTKFGQMSSTREVQGTVRRAFGELARGCPLG